jgi:hypothetical protein
MRLYITFDACIGVRVNSGSEMKIPVDEGVTLWHNQDIQKL